MADKTVTQKLLIKAGYRVLFVHPPPGYIESLTDLPADVVIAAGPDDPGPFDLIQAFVTSQAELAAQLAGLAGRRKPKGLLWITYPKGAAKIKSDFHRDTIWAYAQTIGLAAVAMVAVDEMWSAMRLK